jgi:Flp pilus assembly protein TadD
MDAIVDEVKVAYPSPVGAEIGPYGGNWSTYRGKSEFEGGPYIMDLTIPFYELLNVRSGGIEAGGEYGSSIKIWINYVKYILDPTNIQYGNDRVFKEPFVGIPVNGFPKYNNMILLLPPGKGVPWRPATKQEYLENYIQGLKGSMPGRSKSGQDSQNLDFAQQLLASMSPQEKKQIAYLKKTKYSGEKTGYSDIGYKWAGFIDPSDTTGQKLVIIDEGFYDKTIPRTTIQCMVIDREYPRASISAAAPTKEMLERTKRISDRLNEIVRKKDFLNSLQQLLGKPGLDYVLTKKKQGVPEKAIVVRKPVIKNLDRIVDSLMRNYRLVLPQVPVGVAGSDPTPSKEISMPSPNAKKLALASRKLNTREELVRYLDELDEKLSAALAGTKVIQTADANTATKAAYGYWIFQQPREALLLALRAAKQEPDNNTILNNLGATLSLCGGDYLAVPLYIVCIRKEPANSTLNNNIGQSYLALGQPQLAEQYLKKAIASSPKHHLANNSLGFLYRSQGMNDLAIKCYQNSLSSSFTLEGFNRLKELKKESALKLMDYIRHRYKQPDYINFDKYAVPLQCTQYDQTEVRIAQHKYYQKVIDEQLRKYTKLRDQQKPIAAEANKKYFTHEIKQSIRPFLPFAATLVVCIRKEFETKVFKLEVELKELERKRIELKVEFDSTVEMITKSYEPRLDKLGEGNADPTLEEEVCADMNAAINSFLVQFAELNEERFHKIIHTYKDYLNDYLYWIRFASFTNEQYRLEYYDIVLMMYQVLREVKLTTLHGYCNADKPDKDNSLELKVEDPDCPLPVGVELPFVVGKIQFDCESWGLEIGEGVVFNIEHLMGGATTIAIGPGALLAKTPEIGGEAPMDINPGADAKLKGQLFITFDANTIIDWGLQFEAEIDIRGVGKPLEIKQNVTLAVNKGLTAEGPLTTLIDKYYEIPPEKQLNKNIKIYKPQQ